MGLECVQRAYDLLEAKDWKQEKVTPAGDIISSTERKSLGKVFKLTVMRGMQMVAFEWLIDFLSF